MMMTGVRVRAPACVHGILPLPVARCLGHESGEQTCYVIIAALLG